MAKYKFPANKKIILLTGPSGSGKGALFQKLIENKEIKASKIIPFLTRPKRENEIEGVDSYFISRKEFEEKILNNEFPQWILYKGNNEYYGSTINEINKTFESNDLIITECAIEGLIRYRENIDSKNLISIMIQVPLESLRERLEKRGTENEKEIEGRIGIAESFYHHKYLTQYSVKNENLDDCVEEILEIVKNHK